MRDTTGRASHSGLPVEQENFPVASRLLPPGHRADLLAVYGFARTVDDIGDEAPPSQRAGLLDGIDRDLDRIYAGGTAEQPVMRALAAAVARHRIPERPFRDLVLANRQDQTVSTYQTFDDLLGYCALSADPIGHIVLYLFDAVTPRRLALSDRVCTALQLVEHCQDVAEDHRNGRVYLPQQDLRRFGCTDADLAEPVTPTRLRGVVALNAGRARALLDEGTPVARGLPLWPRLAITGFVAGGRAALAALDRDRYDVLGVASRPTPARLLLEWLRVMGRS